MFGYGTPIGSHFPPHNPAYVDLTGMYPHDIAKAKELLAQAGYPHGFSMTLKLPPPSYARRSGEIVAAQLGADRNPRAASKISNGRSGWIRSTPAMTST